MGINIRAKLMYGEYYSRLINKLSDDQCTKLNEDLMYGDIAYASPYFDSPRVEWFVGYELPDDFDYKGMRIFEDDLKQAEEFIDRFDVAGTVRAVADVV